MMYFDSLQTAWNMAGHGPYVWSSYALTCVVLGYLIIAPLRRTRDIERELFAQRRRDLAQKQPTQKDNHAP